MVLFDDVDDRPGQSRALGHQRAFAHVRRDDEGALLGASPVVRVDRPHLVLGEELRPRDLSYVVVVRADAGQQRLRPDLTRGGVDQRCPP